MIDNKDRAVRIQRKIELSFCLTWEAVTRVADRRISHCKICPVAVTLSIDSELVSLVQLDSQTSSRRNSVGAVHESRSV